MQIPIVPPPSEKRQWCGGVGATTTHPFLHLLDQFAIKIDLWAPNTFPEFIRTGFEGKMQTFFGNSPLGTINDFVFVSKDIEVSKASTFPLEDFSMPTDEPDHIPIITSVKLPIRRITKIKKRRVVKYDRQCNKFSPGLQTLKERLRHPPIIPYNVDPNTQVHILNTFVEEALVEAFPKIPTDKKLPFLPESVSALNRVRGRLAGELRKLKKIRYTSPCVFFFLVWAQKYFSKQLCFENTLRKKGQGYKRSTRQIPDRYCFSEVYGFLPRSYFVYCCQCEEQFRRVTGVLRGKCKEVVDDVFRQSESTLAQAFEKFDAKKIYAKIRRLLPSRFFEAARMKDEQGKKADDYVGSRNVFRKYFCKLLCGVVGTFESLVKKDLTENIDKISTVEPFGFEPALVPRMYELEIKMAHRGASGVGESCIGGEAIRLVPHELASLYHPLYTKAVSTCTLPVSDKGGQLHELYKGSGDPDNVEMFRDISLCDDIAKTAAGTVREHIMPLIEEDTLGTQYGSGLHGGTTSMAYLYIQSCKSLAVLKNLSLAVVYVDLRTAFATMVRETFLDIPESDKILKERLEQRGVSDECIEYIMDEMRDRNIWDSQGRVKDHTRRLVGNYHSNTWASTEGLRNIIHTRGGSLAGHPLGDIVFTLMLAFVLSRIRTRLVQEGLLFKLSRDKVSEVFFFTGALLDRITPGLVETSFVDDMAFPILCLAASIEDAIARTMQIIDSELVAAGLYLNLKKGKTEILTFFRGPAANIVRKRIFSCAEPVISFVNDFGQSKQVRLTLIYKHLGSLTTFASSNMPDLISRFSMANDSFKSIRRKIISNEHFPVNRRLLVVSGFLLAKVLHHGGSWGYMTLASYRKIHTGIMRYYRAVLLLDKPGAPHISDDELLEKLGVLSPLSLVFSLTFMQLFAIFKRLPVQVLLILAHVYDDEASWVRYVEAALNKLSEEAEALFRFKGKVMTIADWYQEWYLTEGKLEKQVKSALWEPRINKARYWAPVGVTDSQGQVQGEMLHCELCPYQCKTSHGLGWHMYYKHGVRPPIRAYITTTRCESCLQDFYTRERLIKHVNKVSKCLTCYVRYQSPHPQEVIEALEEEAKEVTAQLRAKGFYREKAQLTPERAEGPLLLEAVNAGVSHAYLLGKRPAADY